MKLVGLLLLLLPGVIALERGLLMNKKTAPSKQMTKKQMVPKKQGRKADLYVVRLEETT